MVFEISRRRVLLVLLPLLLYSSDYLHCKWYKERRSEHSHADIDQKMHMADVKFQQGEAQDEEEDDHLMII